MRVFAIAFMLAALAMPIGVVAEEDDGIMGDWTGSYTGSGGKSHKLHAQIVSDGGGKWHANFLVDDEKKCELQGSTNTAETPVVPFTGEADVEGEKRMISATYEAGKITGKLEGKKATFPFELTRQKIESPTLGQSAPEGAIVLFDGTRADEWQRIPLLWNIVDGAMRVTPSNFMTRQEFGSCVLHIEFMTPFMPNERGQGRGNSGVYIQGRYEVQVLDSYGMEPADNLCGGIYKQAVPKTNACLPPLSWQTYDITFHAPKFDASGKKIKNAVITVVHNGIPIHENLTLTSATPGGVSDQEAPSGPLLLQDHHNDLGYRNIWIQPIND